MANIPSFFDIDGSLAFFNLQVPNAIGVVLGSAQLILYSIYKNKSGSEKSDQDTEKEEEEVSAHLVKGGGGIQMKGYDDGSRNRAMLNKGSSLPKPSIIRQHSVKKLVKALSMSPYELHAGSSHEEEEDDSRNGDLEAGKNGGFWVPKQILDRGSCDGPSWFSTVVFPVLFPSTKQNFSNFKNDSMFSQKRFKIFTKYNDITV